LTAGVGGGSIGSGVLSLSRVAMAGAAAACGKAADGTGGGTVVGVQAMAIDTGMSVSTAQPDSGDVGVGPGAVTPAQVATTGGVADEEAIGADVGDAMGPADISDVGGELRPVTTGGVVYEEVT
jgi:hypothetical protein